METLNSDVKIKLLDINAHIPVKASIEAAGYDIYSGENTILEPGEYKAISTGFSLEMHSGMEAQVRPRSGLALKHGVTVLNSPGTIDSDYRGEVKIILINHSKNPFEIKIGERIAQLVFSKIMNICLIQTNSLAQTKRGDGGFGSTGIHTIK
ncbi:MAG: deoxyuridine 5'-triphosphate nucleotidohydrolase [Spirochaetes bacterium GWF1_31_7]|nr:MAG: deoxyuridine 5'-triphosphate nucleotidohydrolase [Spirochaetes bacterium GWE1_32_154]OHD44866.1 MAG: deoxyuridine 5'-triphosphate nucleotidohydrolase [Spirochaetes bacterium GWE2_31_10]OHD47657.1 MAG: deoxyuridine 5'-triphosphate nucleotidohydrolase [Spirochaetes bacterium GWF1_31_7]HBD94434.1 dUTP diphosphatase [Spirochaetia bacterium]HBI37680.1 dUTP diphosphatase [Spirochaetia bacterium]